VQAECYNDPTLLSDFTPYLDTYVEPIPVPEYECGKVFPDREITNLELKHSFAPGEIVESKNGDTRYEIIYANENNGYLSGQFFMIMDCWGGAKIRCEFSQTQINTDNIVLKTIFHNVPDSTLYVKPETIRKEIQEAFFDAATVLTDFSIKDTVKIDKPYTYLYINPSGKVMAVIDDKGKIKTEETNISATSLKENTLIQGKNGEELVLTKKGQVMGKNEFNATGGNSVLLKEYHRKSDSLAQWQINFSKYDAQTYAFDHIGSGNHGIFSGADYYPQVGSYDFRYKSVECGKNDKVKVEFGSYPQADSVVFKDKYGVTYPIKDRILTFTGVSKADTNFIYAYRGDQKIGKLFVNTYQQKIYKVVFVKVNGAAKKLNAKEITKYLNKVYNQCAVSFEDSIDNITINDLTSFSHGGSGILTVYNDDQKRVLQAYDKEMKDGVYYLFFIDNVTDKKDGSGTLVSGYMPRGYNCGFIYDGGSERTIAHELGHGIAGLEHVFENSNNSGKTANLMDYAEGDELWHFQWDQIQDPSRVWMKWNKAEEEGENLEEQDLRNLFRYTIPDYPVSGIFIAPSEWPIWIDDVMTAFVLVPSGYGISLSNRQRPDAAIYGFITTDNETFMAKFSESGHFEGFYNTDGDALYVDKDNVTLTNYHRTGSPVYYWDIQSRSFYNNLYVAPNEPVGDEWTPYYYSAVIPDYMEEARQRNLEKLLKKKADGQSQYWFYDVKNNKIVVILGYTGGRVLRKNNGETIDLRKIKDAEIKEFPSMAAFAGSEYNWLANDVRSTMNEAGKYVVAGLTITAAAPYLLEAALVGEGVSGKFAEGFLSDFVSNSVANMVTYFIVEHWINDNPKKTWNEYFDFKEMVLDASIAGAKNLYAPASLKGKLLYDATVDGIQAVEVMKLLESDKTSVWDQVVNFGIGAGVAVIVDAITPRLTRKLAKHSFTKMSDFVQLRKAVTSTTFAKNEKFVSVINQLLAGVAVPKVFKFSANIDEKQLRTVVGNLLNTDQGALSLNLIRRSSKEFTSVEEFERLADNLVSSFANVNISNCSDIINDISPKIIDGIVDLSLSPYHYATTDVFLNKLFMSKLSNKTDILNVCFTHQHSALLVGDLCRRIDEYDIGDLVKRIS
ncbi:MAG: hypothetical protein IKB95_03335, partial [Bacteroidales bacterium]|nr:hypothetical protein [Bacteroidales bacterium]